MRLGVGFLECGLGREYGRVFLGIWKPWWSFHPALYFRYSQVFTQLVHLRRESIYTTKLVLQGVAFSILIDILQCFMTSFAIFLPHLPTLHSSILTFGGISRHSFRSRRYGYLCAQRHAAFEGHDLCPQSIPGQSISVRAKGTWGHPLEVNAILFYPHHLWSAHTLRNKTFSCYRRLWPSRHSDFLGIETWLGG